jgi:hypothetical protein
VVSATASDTTGLAVATPAGTVTLRDCTIEPADHDGLLASSGAITRLLPRHRSCILPTTAIAAMGRRPTPAGAITVRSRACRVWPADIVGTPTRALAAPSELHPAGRRHAPTPPYHTLRPSVTSLERSFQRCNRGYVVAAEPFSDTPVVMPPKPHEYSICASLSPYQPLAGGGFSVPALFSRDRRRRNYLPAMPVVRMPSQAQALQST